MMMQYLFPAPPLLLVLLLLAGGNGGGGNKQGVQVAQAMAPPNYEGWGDEYESVHQYRRRMGIDFNYEPEHVTHEHCRYFTEEKCMEEDDIYASAKRHRKLNPAIGTFNILSLMIYFPETKSNRDKFPTKKFLDVQLNGPESNTDINPGGSAKEWLRFQSLDQYHANFILQDWVEAGNTEAHFSGGQRGQLGVLEMQQTFVKNLDDLDKAGFDFSPYDADNDGDLDGVVVFTTGLPAEMGPIKCVDNRDPNNRIWSQAAPGPATGGWESADGKYRLGGYVLGSIFGPDFCSQGEQSFKHNGLAIFAHEFGHTFNLVDLYDFDFNGESKMSSGNGGVGMFDTMSYAYGMKSDNTMPGYLSTYSKMMIDWVVPLEISEDGFYTIMPQEFTRHVYIITDCYPGDEWLIIENRYKYKWNQDWEGDGGIAIYKVDDKAPLQSERGYPGHDNWPAEHYRIAVLQKDGNYDIEKLVNVGDQNDFYVQDDTLEPSGGDPNKWPNTDSIQNGQVDIGLTIRVTTPPGYLMEFEVTGYKPWSG